MKEGPNKKKQYKQKTAAEKRGTYKISVTATVPSVEDFMAAPANSELVKQAAVQATETQLHRGIPVVWMEEGVIFQLHPDGRKESISSPGKKAHQLSQKRFYIQK